MVKIKKAIIPAAGLGSRFLPWSKAMPKEMLPIVDKPVIQYIVEECVEAGITESVMGAGYHKRAIEDHFDRLIDLEYQLKKQGKEDKAILVRKIAQMANFIYVRQKGPYGNATPVLSAKTVVGNEYFAVLWGDQFILAHPSRLKQCLEVFEKYQCPVISCLEVDEEQKKTSGIGKVEPFKDNIYVLKEIVEKPGIKKAPSNLMVSGVYILPPSIFPILEKLKPGRDQEIWLVDAINQLCQKPRCLAVEIKGGKFYDTGNKLAYHKTVVDFMLKDKEIGQKIKEYIKRIFYVSSRPKR